MRLLILFACAMTHFSLTIGAGLAQTGKCAYASDNEATQWRGVGVLSMDGGVCTGALIAPDLVLTAAHCVADFKRKTIMKPSQITFYAGLRNRKSAAVRGATRVSIHPGYFAAKGGYSEARIRTDVAQIRLDAPIASADAQTYRISYTPDIGSRIALVGYSGDRLKRVSVQAPCRLVERKTEFLRSSCLSEPGASGSPIFEIRANGDVRIVALNIGTRRRQSERSGLGLTLDHVRDWLTIRGAQPVAEGFKRVTPETNDFKRVKP
jgi:protease YdgD